MDIAVVELHIVSGEGAIVAEDETGDPALVKMTRPALEIHTPRPVAAASQISGTNPIRLLGAATFKAAPFQEPMTGMILMRDRWYDPRTGTFLSPDPLGHRDSANLYSYCGGDPVNCSDPTGDKIQFKGNNPRAGFDLFKASLHNPAAANLLDLDTVHGNVVAFKKGATKEQFIRAALPQWPYFEANERDLGIPVSTDKRSIEEKYASLITSPRLIEITAESGAVAYEKPDAFLRFFGVKSIPHKAAAEGGGVTLFASESVSGNTSIALDPAYVKLSGPTIASWYGVDAYDAELVLTHELGHALADIEGVAPCRQTWSVYLENQMRSRMGHYGNLRYSEFPVNKDPKTMRCGHEEPGPKPTKP